MKPHIPFRDGFLVDEARIEGELLTLMDWHTDDHLITTGFSWIFCDVERFADDHQEVMDGSIRFFDERGYSLGVDWPYKGTIVPLKHYDKDKRVTSIMRSRCLQA